MGPDGVYLGPEHWYEGLFLMNMIERIGAEVHLFWETSATADKAFAGIFLFFLVWDLLTFSLGYALRDVLVLAYIWLSVLGEKE